MFCVTPKKRRHRITNIKNTILYYSAKRGLDMGLTRGVSGAIQAKHLLGMAAANYAGGPGRRRRNAH